VRKDEHGKNGMHVLARYQCFVSGEGTEQQAENEADTGRVKLRVSWPSL